METELLPLVEVHRPRQRQQEERRGARARPSELDVDAAPRPDRGRVRVGGDRPCPLEQSVPGDRTEDVVVVQRPRELSGPVGMAGRADRRQGGEPFLHALTELRGVPRAHDEIEVEGLVQLVGPHVRGGLYGARRPRLGDEHELAAWLVAVRQRTPGAVDVVDVGLMQHRRGGVELGVVVRQPGRLEEAVRHVDAESVDAAVEPVPQHPLEVRRQLRVPPVEVGLPGVEEVQVPLPRRPVGRAHARPRGAAKHRPPVVGRLVPVRPAPVPEEKPSPMRSVRRLPQGGPEPLVLGRAVVRDEIEQDTELACVRGVDQSLERRVAPENVRDPAVVGDVVATVPVGRRVARREPQGIDAERDQMVEARGDSVEIADAVAVGVRERLHVDLVDDGLAPPRVTPGAVVGRHVVTH